MTTFRITATRKDGPDYDRRIDAVQLEFSQVWGIDQVIQWIDSGVHRFYTSIGGIVAEVYVRRRGLGAKYLTTSPDGYQRNNLLILPDC